MACQAFHTLGRHRQTLEKRRKPAARSKTLARAIESKYDIALGMVTHEDFQHRLDKLQEFTPSQNKVIENPMLRVFQIEAAFNRHLIKT